MAVKSEQETVAYYNSLPKKRVGSGILIFNAQGQLLIVKPNYLYRWLCPGGGVDEGESPLAAARRECKEEIGVEFADVWPAFIDYRQPRPDGQTDTIQFAFTTTPVDDAFLDSLHLQRDEIDDAKFIDVSELPNHFSAARAKAVATYCNNRNGRTVLYMENGELIA